MTTFDRKQYYKKINEFVYLLKDIKYFFKDLSTCWVMMCAIVQNKTKWLFEKKVFLDIDIVMRQVKNSKTLRFERDITFKNMFAYFIEKRKL